MAQIHLFIVLVVAMLMGSATAAVAENEDQASIVRGGRLYDNWHKEIKERVPKNRQPAYPADKVFANQPEINWRCKECHGWDYLGSKGAYGQGKHFTGIKGIRGKMDAPRKDIITILRDKNHDYHGLLNEDDLKDLANFVSKGQIIMDDFILRKTKMAKGDSSRHKASYNTICANCHGSDGKKITTMSPLGEVSREDPWKALHTILNGHPHETMPALRVLGMEVVLDILAYIQTLPEKDTLASVIRGGRLYDNWFEEKKILSKPLPDSLYPFQKKGLMQKTRVLIGAARSVMDGTI